MRKLLFFMLVSFTVSCNNSFVNKNMESDTSGIQVKKKLYPIISNITGVKCYSCGQWGLKFMNEIVNYEEVLAISFYVGPGSGIDNEGNSYGMGNIFAEHIFQDRIDYRTSSNFFYNFKCDEYNTIFETNQVRKKRFQFDDNNIEAATNFVLLKKNGKYYVDTKTVFYKDTDDEYYLGFYLVEDYVENKQLGCDLDYNTIHRNVFRGSLIPFTYGVKLNSTSILTGASIKEKIKLKIPEDIFMKNCKVVSILWKREKGKYSFVNAKY